jgi:hypothetical protein
MYNYGFISVNHFISISTGMLTKHQKLRIIQRMINVEHQKRIYNLAGSQIRADTIKSWLVQQGIDSLRLIAIGYGEANPIADNRTTEGRAQNNLVGFIER